MKLSSWIGFLWNNGNTSRRRLTQPRITPVTVIAELLEDRTLLTAAPVLETIADVTLLAGSPLQIPIKASHPDGETLTFSAQSSDPLLIETFIPTGNRSLRIEVEHFGVMEFQLFEDRAPRATQQIIELAESGFYDGIIFHRVIDGFMIQGGDPTGTGTGGSPLDDFDDQFHPDLQHNRGGILSMAKSLDDTNDSQFFITEGPTRHLDFNHTIFGLLTKGDDVREAISNVNTDSGDHPFVDVVMSKVEVFYDPHNGVLQISAPEGVTGEADVTVTVTDEDGDSASQTFHVTIIADTINNNPYLEDVPEVRTDVDTPVVFNLSAIDVEDDPVVFTASVGQGHAVSIDSDTGEVTVTPADGFRGVIDVNVSVRSVSGTTTDDQTIPVFVGPDIIMHEVTADGGDTLSVTYEVLSESVEEFDISFFRSSDAAFQAGLDELLASVLIDDAADRTVGMHTLTFTVGGGEGEVALPGAGADETDDEYRLLAVADANNDVVEADVDHFNEDNTVVFTGIYHLAGGPVFVHGSDDDDTMTVTPGSITVDANGVVVVYDDIDVTEIRARGHQGNDTFDARDIGVPIHAWGGDGNDLLLGGTQDDVLRGGPGNDTLAGCGGDDQLMGGEGVNRALEWGNVDFMLTDSQLAGLGTDTLSNITEAELTGGSGNNQILAFGFTGKTTLNGGDGDDTLFGGYGDDQLTGGTGNDWIDGFGGHNTLVETADVDMFLSNFQMTGGLGIDFIARIDAAQLTGMDGDNTLDAGQFSGPVTILGHGGNDKLTGGEAGDSLVGGEGHDTINGRKGNDTLIGGEGNDQLLGGGDIDALYGGNGDDSLRGQTGDDSLHGDGGNDTLTGDNGNDVLQGGEGDDALLGGQGLDTLDGNNGNDQLNGEGGDDFLNGGRGHDSISGGGGNDQIFGGAGDDFILGEAGNDTINGQGGNDSLNGGSGHDSLIGSTGNDGLAGGGGNDTLNGNGGTDTLLGGDGDDRLFGGSDSDILLGGDGIDRVDGQGGDDTVAGGGNDIIADEDDTVLGETIDDSFLFDAPWVNV